MSRQDLKEVNKTLKQIKYPHDFSKKVSSITEKEIKRAKACEMQVLLLHVLLPCLKSFIPDNVFCHLGLLVTALQLLNKDVAVEEDINLPEQMLDEYHRVDVEIYGVTSQTFTNHALIHLADQRRKNGCSLLLLSNFIFEGFIASLKRQYHGTRGIVQQMVRNIGLVQNLSEMKQAISNDSVRNLAENISKKNFPNCFDIDDNTFMFGTIQFTQPMQDKVDLPDQFKTGNVRYSQSLRYKNNTYHSFCYHFKRKSNSYTIYYRNPLGVDFLYGIIMFFFAM